MAGVGLKSGRTGEPTTPAKTGAAKQNGLRIGELSVGRVLILGNSITLHGPAENIGWTGNWGMAASAAEKDYVHLLLERIAKAANGQPQSLVRNIADFERQYASYDVAAGLKPALEFQADVIVLAIGENVPALKSDEEKVAFQAAISRLLSKLKDRGSPTVIVRSCFWADAAKDECLRTACDAAGGVFVDIGPLGRDEANYARSERKIEHAGVAAHPGDKGMEAIADAVWKAIEARAAAR
jgi:hypothetical protein